MYSYWENTALNHHKSVEEMSHCILAVTKEIQVLSFLSASYAPLGYAKSFSFYTLFHPFCFFSGWLLERPFIFLRTHWLSFSDSNPSAGPCRNDIKISPLWGHVLFLPTNVLWVWIAVLSFHCAAKLAVSWLTQSQVRKEEWKPERHPRMPEQKTIRFLCQKYGKTKDMGLAWKIL